MKNFLLLILVLFLISFKSYSEEKINKTVCEEIADLATSIMDARQAGVDIIQMMQLAEGNKAVEFMIKEAYKQPEYTNKEFKNRAIKEFKENMYLLCLKEN